MTQQNKPAFIKTAHYIVKLWETRFRQLEKQYIHSEYSNDKVCVKMRIKPDEQLK